MGEALERYRGTGAAIVLQGCTNASLRIGGLIARQGGRAKVWRNQGMVKGRKLERSREASGISQDDTFDFVLINSGD
ncbi:hypothetical protein Nhal_3974 (plasmid) [Nitrosococcus halophilus Nc 4]|uniref:Uncharacterized protein n=1 Tax=Nitrosococcus halophilus (strain Nc4) TaxID=472759 RepID=D5C5D0_NITHN|nr:hypothetical protein Nhal_3974 [Nitrosococcus halophilus Nc 4]